jgi:hypothetical protein
MKGRILDHVSVTKISSAETSARLIPEELEITAMVSLLRTIAARGLKPRDEAGTDNTIAYTLWSYLQDKSSLLEDYGPGVDPTPTATATTILDYFGQAMIESGDFQQSDELQVRQIRAIETVLQYIMDRQHLIGRTSGGRYYNATDTAQDGDCIVALQGTD